MKLRISPGLIVALFVTITGSALAQQQQQAAPELPMRERLAAWQAEHGAQWRQRVNEETGATRMLFGGQARPSFQPLTDADFALLALEHVATAEPLLGIQTATLQEDRVSFLPLGLVGSSDKLSVRLTQAVDGVPVRGASVNALFLHTGELISLSSTSLPGLEGFDTVPTVAADAAADFAVRTFQQETGVPPTRVSQPELVIVRELENKTRRATLAWEVNVAFERPGFEPEGYIYGVAAKDELRIADRRASIHFFDVGGQVFSNATPGVLPDSASNTPTQQVMRYMTVTSSAGTTTTDDNGFFNFPGVNGPLDVTFGYEGDFNDVNHVQGSEYTQTVSLSGTGNSVTMNASPTEYVTAQANAFYSINLLRDWTRAVNPADATADFVADANVNIDSSCNAYFNGSSTNYYNETADCHNTAYSTVIVHEMGHWLNVLYGSFNGGDGFGEGNADVFAMYLYDAPIVGDDFRTNGGNIRTGTNNRQYCGDGNGGCYGEVHRDGEVLMGVLWKVRENFDASLGNAAGDALGDALFNAWMLSYDQQLIDSIIEVQWITLDDTDGILENGSPHYQDIDDGFTAQGFPSFELSDVMYRNVALAGDTIDLNGPYGVSADLTPLNASSVASASIFYSINGSAFSSVPMFEIPAGVTSTWWGLVPGAGAPAKIRYYLSATDSSGMTDTLPQDAPATTYGLRAGQTTSFFFEDFESGGDNGWTHVEVATQDDWQHDVPQGQSGTSSGVDWSDPSSAASGTRAWGNDLGVSGFDGQYQSDTENYLLSPSIDLSSANGTFLSLQRWLTVERGIYDKAQIRMNGTVVWENDLFDHTVDTAWTPMTIDISDVADGSSAIAIQFRLITDGGLNLGGWNVDDVQILALDPTPSACLPVPYGTGVAGELGLPILDSAGQEMRRGNSEFGLTVKNGRPGATAYIAMGGYRTGKTARVDPLLTTLMVNPYKVYRRTLDMYGQVTLPMPLADDPGLVGTTLYFQALIDDPAAPRSFAFTQGLRVTVCD